jgi:hypothetical protein
LGSDDLAKEVKKKLTAGYPQNNIIFQAPERAWLERNLNSLRGYGKGNLCEAFMSPAFAGSFFHSALYPQLGAVGY